MEGWDGPGCPRPGRESLQNLTACFRRQLWQWHTVKWACCSAQSQHRPHLSEIRTPQRKLSRHMCFCYRMLQNDSYAEISKSPYLSTVLFDNGVVERNTSHIPLVISISFLTAVIPSPWKSRHAYAIIFSSLYNCRRTKIVLHSIDLKKRRLVRPLEAVMAICVARRSSDPIET